MQPSNPGADPASAWGAGRLFAPEMGSGFALVILVIGSPRVLTGSS